MVYNVIVRYRTKGVNHLDTASVIIMLNTINMQLFKKLLARYKKMGIDVTPVHSRIIMLLYDRQEGISQKDIENLMACNKSTISVVLNTMEKNGLIVRNGSEQDSRKKIITLTEKSCLIASTLQKDAKKINKILRQEISEEEMLCFKNVLQKIEQNLERV